ncbi:amidohydrolase family protein [Nisaea sp.]|uniref:amidohydrolase family protein n=1 Tax=Nisaea sp. TaxID=2024842 RepID=UPI003299680C
MSHLSSTRLAIGLAIGLTSLLAPALAHAHDKEPIGDAVNELPLFDAHMHYKEPAWQQFPVESIVELMDRNGVAMALVSSTSDEGTIMLWEYAPNRIVPELRPYHGNAGSSNWSKSSGMGDYLAERLEAYPHEGIGEFHIHRLDTSDEPFFRTVIGLAKAKDIYLHVHSDSEPIRWLYSLDSDVKIIWAHAGLGEAAAGVYALMDEFPELVADTSLKEHAILGYDGKLDPEWEQIIFAFQDRLMVGSDTWINGQWENYTSIMDSNRAWLAKLPEDVARKIAYQNAERLFGREISMEQIGTR